MKFDQEKNQLILQLRKLSSLKNQKPYEELKNAIAEKYGVSIRSVQRWLNKRSPGVRKGRNDSGKPRKKISRKEKALTKELIESGVLIKEAKNIISMELGRPISDRKLKRIREKVDEEILDTKDTPKSEPDESNFGDEAKELFRKLFNLDLVSPERGVPVPVNGRKFNVPKEDVEDICLILANAYNRTGQARFKVDRSRLLKMRIMHLIEQQVRMATIEKVDTKTIESITRMYDKMLENIKIDANIRTVEKVCKELKPDISFEEIISLIEKHTDGIDN